MEFLCLGLSHKTAPVEQREKAALTPPADRAVLRDLLRDAAVSEAAALSTCNRTELYAVGHDRTATEDALLEALVAHSDIRRPELECVRYAHHGGRKCPRLIANQYVVIVDRLESFAAETHRHDRPTYGP